MSFIFHSRPADYGSWSGWWCTHFHSVGYRPPGGCLPTLWVLRWPTIANIFRYTSRRHPISQHGVSGLCTGICLHTDRPSGGLPPRDHFWCFSDVFIFRGGCTWVMWSCKLNRMDTPMPGCKFFSRYRRTISVDSHCDRFLDHLSSVRRHARTFPRTKKEYM